MGLSLATAVASPPATAVLLVGHGSRDPRARAALAHLADQVQQAGQARGLALWVATACLELAAQPLHVQICQAARQARQDGRSRLAILPLFLQPGVHACEDIPAEIATAQLQAPLALALLPHLGAHSAFTASVAASFAALPAAARILLAHGSRRPGSQQPLLDMAAQFGARPAFWAVSPSLADQVAAAYQQGARQMAIQPHLLFAGSLTTAIAAEVERLRAVYPEAHLHLGAPLGATSQLATAIAAILQADIR